MMVKQLQFITLIVLTTLAMPQRVLAISIIDRVNEVSQWFTGDFNNGAQVASNPSIPFIPLSTCAVQISGESAPAGTQNLYLAQPTIGRFRLYSFVPGTDKINLNIRSFNDVSSVSGICNLPTIDRTIQSDNLEAAVCSLELIPSNNSYIGNNSPLGCPTRSGGRVVSSITFQPDNAISLDLIYNSSDRLIVGTQIEFQRIVSVPEPSAIGATLMVSFGLFWWRYQRKKMTQNR